jgi:hypothetical protein
MVCCKLARLGDSDVFTLYKKVVIAAVTLSEQCGLIEFSDNIKAEFPQFPQL